MCAETPNDCRGSVQLTKDTHTSRSKSLIISGTREQESQPR